MMGNPSQYRVFVSLRFLILSLLSCILLAFAVGRTARIILIGNINQQSLKDNHENEDLLTIPSGTSQYVAKLPNPALQPGKIHPQTKYTSRNFNTAGSATIISRFLTSDETSSMGQIQQCTEGTNTNVQKQDSTDLFDKVPGRDDDNEEDEEEIHLPSGQHLLLDIKNVDAAFLSSEERLAKAMLDVVYECGLTLLSYHCHGLEPSGVSCVGVLLESHVSFHTWPEHGVITLDLFTCGPNSLLPIFSSFESLFSVPSRNLDQSIPANRPRSIWSYKLRGFSSDDPKTKSERTDFFTFPIGSMTEYKKEIVSVYTKFIRIDIYDVLRPYFQTIESYLSSLVSDGSYESRNPDTVEPDRLIFLDGQLDSRRSGDAAYHESLVHPAMFAHTNPRHVGIIGGGDGAVLREVLKHKTVENVVMIESDQMLIDLMKEHVPEYSDCSDFLQGIHSCYEDPRVELLNDTPLEWFQQQLQSSAFKKLDVILVSENFYYIAGEEGKELIRLLYEALSTDGILVVDADTAPSLHSPARSYSGVIFSQFIFNGLASAGFKSISDYEEGNSGLEWPWQAIVAFKSLESRAKWFHSESSIDLKVRERTFPKYDGGSALYYFDGATHQSFFYPSKASETIYCRIKPFTNGCDDGSEPIRKELQASVVNTNAESYSILTEMLNYGNRYSNVWQSIRNYMDAHGSNLNRMVRIMGLRGLEQNDGLYLNCVCNQCCSPDKDLRVLLTQFRGVTTKLELTPDTTP